MQNNYRFVKSKITTIFNESFFYFSDVSVYWKMMKNDYKKSVFFLFFFSTATENWIPVITSMIFYFLQASISVRELSLFCFFPVWMINVLTVGIHKRSHILKQTCRFKFQDKQCMYDLFVDTRDQWLRSLPLREKCPYSEIFWYVFSPNAGKYGPGKLIIRIFFRQCA